MPENRCIGDFARCEPNKKRKEIEIISFKNAKIVQHGFLPKNLCIFDLARCESLTKKRKDGKSDLVDDGLFFYFPPLK